MTIEEALIRFLTADASITAIVGSSPARISPTESAQGQAYPRITYSIAHTEDEYTTRVNCDQPTVRVQIDCWAKAGAGDFRSARALAKLVKNSLGDAAGLRLKEFHGRWGYVAGSAGSASLPLLLNSTGGSAAEPGVVIQNCRLDDEYANPVAAQDGGEKQIQRISQDYTISYIEQ